MTGRLRCNNWTTKLIWCFSQTEVENIEREQVVLVKWFVLVLWVLWSSQLLTGHIRPWMPWLTFSKGCRPHQKPSWARLTFHSFFAVLLTLVGPAQLGSEFGFISFRLTDGQKLNRDEGYRTSSITASTKELTALLSPVRCLSSGRLSQSKTFWPWLYIK